MKLGSYLKMVFNIRVFAGGYLKLFCIFLSQGGRRENLKRDISQIYTGWVKILAIPLVHISPKGVTITKDGLFLRN